MHYADIIASMHKSGNPPSKVAKDRGVSRSAVSQVIRGNASSLNIALHISKTTGTPLNRLWPDGRYSHPHQKRQRKAA